MRVFILLRFEVFAFVWEKEVTKQQFQWFQLSKNFFSGQYVGAYKKFRAESCSGLPLRQFLRMGDRGGSLLRNLSPPGTLFPRNSFGVMRVGRYYHHDKVSQTK
jgi:hypothetical protein